MVFLEELEELVGMSTCFVVILDDEGLAVSGGLSGREAGAGLKIREGIAISLASLRWRLIVVQLRTDAPIEDHGHLRASGKTFEQRVKLLQALHILISFVAISATYDVQPAFELARFSGFFELALNTSEQLAVNRPTRTTRSR